MKKFIFPVVPSLFIRVLANAEIANNNHGNSITSLNFVGNNTSYDNQVAIMKAGKLITYKINGISKPFSHMNQSEKSAVISSFNELN